MPFIMPPLFLWTRRQWADDYFLIKHRGETRGLGGIFFDDQNDKGDVTPFFCLDAQKI